jgi:hypothetical protein
MSKIRNPREVRKPKPESRTEAAFGGDSEIELRISFGFRISDFGLIHCMTSRFSKRELLVICSLAIIGFVVLPCLNAFLPPTSPFYINTFTLSLYGKYLTYAVLAMGVNLLWGYTGILSLGQCVFFALGGYALGMYLMLLIAKLGQYRADLPDFMVFSNSPRNIPRPAACRATGFLSTTSGSPPPPSCGCPRWSRSSLVSSPSLAHQGRLFLHTQPGVDLRHVPDVFSHTTSPSAATTASPISNTSSARRC